jgi:hypothetical protein
MMRSSTIWESRSLAAKAQAQQAADELRYELDGAINEWNGWRLDIVCPEGSLLYSLSLGITLH